ncbi:2Fe-2S iron-sulfur cluster-binding protein [Streptomyces oceani]|uniref:(2Fe-2S)-binding protein n=1 Tax=Streptomyces oceani TaxID=1075402 RepID=A0A1E7KFY0_9ACTN|nr:2Fe-2S iron-sulfur cluster-binding protein [Streptomyces oceani]OEV02784.1 (2Fe-2S)-binding protein [Streptomyces oceani]
MNVRITLRVDGEERSTTVDSRTTLLDALREHLSVTSPKKGCDHGQCGACTVLIDGRRMLSCLKLLVGCDGSDVVTANGLGAASGKSEAVRDPAGELGGLHAVQRAFLDHDGFQCGYCTPGQICSAVGMFEEAAAGQPSHVTTDLADERIVLDDAELRERMSGNLCRCGAYVNILAALRAAQPRSPAGRAPSELPEDGA